MNISLLTLYEPEVVKKLALLSVLSKKDRPVTLSELAVEAGYSNASTYKYLNVLSEKIKEYKLTQLDLILKKNNLSLNISETKHYTALRNYLVQECITVKLGIDLILGKQIIKEVYSQENFISQATLKRKIRILKELFGEYQLTLSSVNGELFLKGEESTIRCLAKEALLDLYSEGSWPFETIDERKVEQQVSSFLKTKEDVCLLFNELKFDLAIMILRSQNKKTIQIDATIKEYGKNIERFLVPLTFKNDFPKISKEEWLYFYCILLSEELFLVSEIGTNILNEIESATGELQELIHFSINKFSDEFYYLNSENEEYSLFYIYSLHFFKLNFPNWIGSIHKKKIDLTYPELDRKMVEFVSVLKEKFPKLSKGSIQLLVKNYSLLFGKFQQLSYFEEPIYLQLAVTKSPIKNNLMEKLIYQMFHYKYNIKFAEENVDIHIKVCESDSINLYDKSEESDTYFCSISNQFDVDDVLLIQKILKIVYAKKLEKSLSMAKIMAQ